MRIADNPNVISSTLANQYRRSQVSANLSYFYLVTLYGKPYTFDNGASYGLPYV
jgi:hypothetical protein